MLDEMLLPVRIGVDSKLVLNFLCVLHIKLRIYFLPIFESLWISVPRLNILGPLSLALDLLVLYEQLPVFIECRPMPGFLEFLLRFVLLNGLKNFILHLQVFEPDVQSLGLIFFLIYLQFQLNLDSVILLFLGHLP